MRRLFRSFSLLVIASLVVGGFSSVVLAADGVLDTSFGTGGIVTTGIGDFGRSVALQPDGKILVAGYTDNGSDYDFALARYNSNGSLDNSFGTGGVVTTPIGTSDAGYSVVLQPDGKILVAGYTGAGVVYSFALVRYNPNGSLDNSFGTGGVVTTPIGTVDAGLSIALQAADGKILVAGYTGAGGVYGFALVRYNPNGSLDNSFGTGGVVTTPIGTDAAGYSVALQADGKILVAGSGNPGGVYSFALVRYNSNGLRDNSFGTGGIVTTPIGTDAMGYSVALQADGKILVAGSGNPGGVYSFALVRYNSNGLHDNSFGTGGVVTTNIGTNARGYSVALQPGGKILVAGSTGAPGTGGFALVRYDTNGSPDNSFGTGGVVTTNIGTDDVGLSIALQPDGKILVAGYSNQSGNYEFALVRYGAAPLATPTPAPIVSLHHASLDPNGGSCLINGTATTAPTRTPFLGYTYIPGAEECSRPGFTFQGWAVQTKPETVYALPLLRGWDDGVWRYFIADTYDLIAVWKTIG